ncbi:unnamed protein product [Cylindrotheca closterium]|uniref:Kinesin light chain n=1 Tax=Cylindrotheca closterium TaxID=2856 RepID=A0AAD2G6X0_9STRA|nr:unnamed protein product [Cylindrotheca closterium]
MNPNFNTIVHRHTTTMINQELLPSTEEDDEWSLRTISSLNVVVPSSASNKTIMNLDVLVGSSSGLCCPSLKKHHHSNNDDDNNDDDQHEHEISKTFGHDNLDTAHTYQDIASLLVDIGKYDEALDVCEEILDILLQPQSGGEHNHLAIAATYHQMDEILERKKGGGGGNDLKASMSMYEAAL